MSYGKVYDVFWEDDKIEELSDRAALLALFLITGPHRNAIGCFRLGIGAITDFPRFAAWGIEGVSDTLSELVRMGFCYRDDRTGWTFIRNALKHDPVKGDKAAIHAASLATKIPTNTVAYRELYQRLNPILRAYDKKLTDKPGWPMRTPCEGACEGASEGASKGDVIPLPSPLPSPSPAPSPEPDVSAPSAPTGRRYAFEGRVIRLTPEHYEGWKSSYRYLDLDAALQNRDDWLATEADPQTRKNWFVSTSNWLAKRNEAARKPPQAEPRADFRGVRRAEPRVPRPHT